MREVPYAQTALVANVRFSLPHGGCASSASARTAPWPCCRGQSAQARVAGLVWTFPQDQQAAIAQLSDSELLNRLQAAFGYRLGRFEAIGQRQFYPLRLVVATEQVRSHLVLQGNAAHFLHPVAGQGFNLSLRDGLRLAQVLSEGAALGERLGELKQLNRYAQAAQTDQNRTIALSDGFNRIFSRRERSLRWGGGIWACYCWRLCPPCAPPSSANSLAGLSRSACLGSSKPMPNADAPVVIVGAGLVGASLALALSQRLPQVSIVLIDQQGPQQPLPAAQFDPRVVALNLASQSLLAQLGVWAAVERQCAYEQMQVWDGEGSGSIEFSAREMGANALGWIVENGELLAELHRLIALAPRITLAVRFSAGSAPAGRDLLPANAQRRRDTSRLDTRRRWRPL